MSTLAAIGDIHVKDMGKAACGSYSQSPAQGVTREMKFTDTLGAISIENVVYLTGAKYVPGQYWSRTTTTNIDNMTAH